MVEYLLLLWSITSKRMNFLLLWFKFSACKLTTNTSYMQFADLNMCFPDHISRTEIAPSQILVGNRKWNGCLLQSPLKSRSFLFLRECAKLSQNLKERDEDLELNHLHTALSGILQESCSVIYNFSFQSLGLLPLREMSQEQAKTLDIFKSQLGF